MKAVEFWLSEEGQTILSSWVREGLGIKEIAEKIGISPKTLQRWAYRYSEIRDKLFNSPKLIDAKVEEAILKKALGFETTEVRQVKKANGDEEITAVTKVVPPDLSACSFWLKNSCPEKWGDSKSTDSSKVDEILSRLDLEGEDGDL